MPRAQGALAYSLESRTALDLMPLIFWDHCSKHPDIMNRHCYIYDIKDNNEGLFSYKAAGYECSKSVSVTDEETNFLAKTLQDIQQKDLQFSIINEIDLIEVQK